MNRCVRPTLAALLTVACGGASTHPPPAASPSPADGLRPLSSREAGEASAGSPALGVEAGPTLPPGHPPVEGPPSARATGGARVSGTVALAASHAGRAAGGGVLYVIAKKDGATLAVRRLEVARFPVAFELSEADVMVQGTPFTGPVEIVARLSKTGDALPAPGDIEGTTRGVALGATGVEVRLETVRQ